MQEYPKFEGSQDLVRDLFQKQRVRGVAQVIVLALGKQEAQISTQVQKRKGKGLGGGRCMAQAVELLPCKHKVMNSNPSTRGKKN
jgi:hypothetical protein